MPFTIQPHPMWPDTHSGIYENGELRMGVPHGQEDEAIARAIETTRQHYQEIVNRKAAADPRLVIARGRAYSIGSSTDYPKGFSGTRWLIRFLDGRRAITDSLWGLGDIPTEWRAQLPDNAILREIR